MTESEFFAAKYQELDAECFSVNPGCPLTIQLFNTLFTQRGGDVEVARFHVPSQRVDEEEIMEEYWEEFDQAVVNLEEGQEELGTTTGRRLANSF